MQNFRSLEAYNFFILGWVQTVYHKSVVGNHIVFKADVRPSWQVTEEPHHPWVAVTVDCNVVAAHCVCVCVRQDMYFTGLGQ